MKVATWDPGFFRQTRHISAGEWLGTFSTARAALAAAHERGAGQMVVLKNGANFELRTADLDHKNLALTSRRLSGATPADGECRPVKDGMTLGRDVVALIAEDGTVIQRGAGSHLLAGAAAIGASDGVEAQRNAAVSQVTTGGIVACGLQAPSSGGVRVR